MQGVCSLALQAPSMALSLGQPLAEPWIVFADSCRWVSLCPRQAASARLGS